MVKVKSWIFTEVRGKVKKAEFRRRKNKVTELSQKRIPFNPRTEAQQTVRKAYGECVEEWNKLSESEKREWRIVGTLLGISGYNAFMRDCITKRLGAVWYEITIDNSTNSNDLTDYQVLLEIINDSTFFEDCKNEKKYLEFYDTDKSTLLNHFVEEFDTTNKNAKIWIKVPSIPANSTKTIYLKINTRRTSDLSNPDNVFDFYDAFGGTSLNTDKWQTIGTFDVLETVNGELHAKTEQGSALVVSKSIHNRNIIIESVVRLISREVGEAYLVQDIDNWMNNYYYKSDQWYERIKRRLSGSESILATQNVSLSYDTYYLLKTILKSSDIIFKIYDMGGNLKVTVTASDTTWSNGYVGFRTYGSSGSPAEWYVDWIRVRKYTEPEPTLSYEKI